MPHVHTIEPTHLTTNPDGSVEVGILWNGQAYDRPFVSRAAAIDFGREPLQTNDQALSLFLAEWLSRNPAGDSDAAFMAKRVVVDFAAQNIIKVENMP